MTTLHQFAAECTLPRPREDVFTFFSDARNLGLITPPWLQFAITSTHEPSMREGLLIDYRIRLQGLPMSWQSEISAWEPPYRFVDEQRRGPYHTWIHEHLFEEVDEGTVVRDVVLYRPRGGEIIHRCFVRPSIEKIFAFRTRVLGEMFSVTAG